MEEIKVGECVRFKCGLIYKATEYWLEEHYKKEGHTYDIVKHSSNIIDLIEVGDYVNGKLVKHIADFEGVKEPIRKLIFVDEHRLVPGETAKNDEIKSIVTKEMIKSVEYRLED